MGCAPSPSDTSTITQPTVTSATPISSATIAVSESTATVIISLTPEIIENVEQATATPEEEVFAEPTLDNVEIMGNEWLERWTKDRFPLPPGTPDGGAYFGLGCINDEIITGKAEIMGPDGQGTGIYLLAGAECWYTESGQNYAVLTPLAITNQKQMVIAGYAVKDHNPVFEGGTEEDWNGYLESRGFIGRGHIFLVSVIVPGNRVKGTNQGLANEELGLVYTQELIEQFANGNGDPSMLPFVVIDGVKYYVLPPFDIGMKTTLNRVGKNPYAQE